MSANRLEIETMDAVPVEILRETDLSSLLREIIAADAAVLKFRSLVAASERRLDRAVQELADRVNCEAAQPEPPCNMREGVLIDGKVVIWEDGYCRVIRPHAANEIQDD